MQLSRGKAEASVLFELSLVLRDCGRLAAELCLFATAEFGFVRLPHAMTTGSSMMPQKRNPDVFELVRGRAAEGVASLIHVLGIAQQLPSGYHRDLQHTKGPLFRGIDTTADVVAVLTHAIPGLVFDGERTAAACDPSLDATARAVALVAEEGVSFREAYRRVGAALRR